MNEEEHSVESREYCDWNLGGGTYTVPFSHRDAMRKQETVLKATVPNMNEESGMTVCS